MGKHHHHSHSNDSTKAGLSLAFWMNAVFSVIELIGGILTNSTAIIADAFHDFMDAVAIGIALILEKVSGRKRSKKYSYGYKRFSLLSAVGMSVFLLAGAVLMIIKAVQSLIHPEVVNSVGMLGLAVLGIAVNGFAFLRIRNAGKESHHAHSHTQNHNSRAIMLHLLEDILGWIAVLIGSVIIYFTSWFWIDAVLAIGIAVFISYNAINNLLNTMKIFLQSVPGSIHVDNLSAELRSIEGIHDFHDLHIWTLDGNYHVASLHVIINPVYKGREEVIYDSIIQLMDKYHIQHPTIQMETTASNCRFMSC